jgi:site-specific DNA recombinase
MTTRAVIYVRISRDPLNKRYGVEDQEERCRALAASLGWEVVRVFEDNDESATKEKDPPRYREMLAFIEAGLADAILVDVVDRLHRQMWKFAPFMHWRKKRGVKLATTQGDNTETASGRQILNIKMSIAEGEWERTQERIKANQRKRARDGIPNGGKKPYYVEHPEAIPWVQEAATAILGSGSLYGVAKAWNKAGRRTAEDNQWTPRAIRRMLLSPSVVGKQELDGELYRVNDWPVVLDEEVWASVTAVLTTPGRRLNEINQRKYMLSGLLKCANLMPNGEPCGNNLTSTGPRTTTRRGAERHDQASFECSKHKTSGGGCGKVKIQMSLLERYVTEAVFFALDTPRFRRALAGQEGAHADEIKRLAAQEMNDKATLIRLEDELDDGTIDRASFNRRSARVSERLAETSSRLVALRRANRRASLPTGEELRQEWEGYDDLKRREIVSAVVDRINVSPHPRGVSSAPPRRKGEDEETWRARFDAVRMETVEHRTDIRWSA